MNLLNSLPNKFPFEKEVQILSVFHLLETSMSFFEVLNNVSDLKSVIAIPYSSKEKIIDEYRARFVNTSFVLPNTIGEIQENIVLEYRKLEPNKSIIIIEVGGYSAPLLDILLRINPNLIGIVEDTNQGHWSYEKIKSDLTIPVYSIAQSKIKSLENRLIGKAIIFSLEDILRKSFYKTFCGLVVTVLGYGKIGKSVVRTLKNRDSIIKVWDTNSISRFQARLDGYFCPRTKAEAITKSDIVLGVSGSNSLLYEDIKYLKNGAVLVSGSSKDVEFRYDELVKTINKDGLSENYDSLILDGKVVSIINKGRPVNFLNNSVLSSVLELVFAELYLCIYSILKNQHFVGLYQIDSKFHELLCDQWEEHYLESEYDTV